MDIVLGSMSPIKMAALQAAVQSLGWNGAMKFVSVPSGIASQPVGEDQATHGARNRALGAQVHDPHSMAIGIESGIRELYGAWEDWAVIVLRLPSGQEFIVHSDGVPVPMEIVEEVRARGFSMTTIGTVLAEQHGTPTDDPHGFLTEGRCSREQSLVPALVRILELALQHIG